MVLFRERYLWTNISIIDSHVVQIMMYHPSEACIALESSPSILESCLHASVYQTSVVGHTSWSGDWGKILMDEERYSSYSHISAPGCRFFFKEIMIISCRSY